MSKYIYIYIYIYIKIVWLRNHCSSIQIMNDYGVENKNNLTKQTCFMLKYLNYNIFYKKNNSYTKKLITIKLSQAIYNFF